MESNGKYVLLNRNKNSLNENSTIYNNVYTFYDGIHFDYKKEKIIIVKGMMIKSINMKDVKYFSLEEINKTKKGNLTQKLVDTYD